MSVDDSVLRDVFDSTLLRHLDDLVLQLVELEKIAGEGVVSGDFIGESKGFINNGDYWVFTPNCSIRFYLEKGKGKYIIYHYEKR